MYKNATLTHREILIFSAVIVVIFVLFFAPNYAVIQKIQRDVADLTVEDAAAHLAHKYCATDDMVRLSTGVSGGAGSSPSPCIQELASALRTAASSIQ